MNKMMMVVAATLSFAAFAEGPAAPAGAPAMPAEHSNRPLRPPMAMGGGAVDPVFRAVMNPQVVEKLGLSDDQKAKLKALKGDRAENQDLQAKVRAGVERQVELLKAEKIDEGAVMQAIDEVFEARKEIAKAQTKRVIAVRSILTPEQAAKALKEAREVRSSRLRANNRGFRGKRGAGPREKGPKCEGPACEPAPDPAPEK